MKIHVRRRHIDRGSQSYCPLEIALTDMMRKHVYVTRTRAYHSDKEWLLPRSARRFILRFDEGKPVKPFAFVLK